MFGQEDILELAQVGGVFGLEIVGELCPEHASFTGVHVIHKLDEAVDK